MFRVEDIGILRKSLVTFVGDVDKVRVIVESAIGIVMTDLSTFAMFLQSFYRCLEDVVIAYPCPTAHQRTLSHLGHIRKAIIVLVVRLVEYLVVA